MYPVLRLATAAFGRLGPVGLLAGLVLGIVLGPPVVQNYLAYKRIGAMHAIIVDELEAAARYRARYRHWPARREVIAGRLPPHVTAAWVESRPFRLVYQLAGAGDAASGSGTVAFRPLVSAAHRVAWRCSARGSGLPGRYLPAGCR